MRNVNQLIKDYRHSRYIKKITKLKSAHLDLQNRFYDELQCGSNELDSYILAFQ